MKTQSKYLTAATASAGTGVNTENIRTNGALLIIDTFGGTGTVDVQGRVRAPDDTSDWISVFFYSTGGAPALLGGHAAGVTSYVLAGQYDEIRIDAGSLSAGSATGHLCATAD